MSPLPGGVPASEVKHAVKALKAFRAVPSDDDIPALQLIHVVTVGSDLVLLASNRYVVGSFRFPRAGTPVAGALGPEHVAVLLGLPARASVSFDGGVLETSTGVSLPLGTPDAIADGLVAFMRSAVQRPRQEAGLVAFTPKVVAALRSASRTGWEPMSMSLHGAGKPVVVSIGGYFTGVVQTVTVAGTTPEHRSDSLAGSLPST